MSRNQLTAVFYLKFCYLLFPRDLVSDNVCEMFFFKQVRYNIRNLLDASQYIIIDSRECKVNVGEFRNTESMSLTEVHLTASPNKSIWIWTPSHVFDWRDTADQQHYWISWTICTSHVSARLSLLEINFLPQSLPHIHRSTKWSFD